MANQEEDDLHAKLAAYGERFMSMFDDYDEQKRSSSKPSTSAPSTTQGRQPPKTKAKHSKKDAKNNRATGMSCAAPAATSKQQQPPTGPQQQQQQQKAVEVNGKKRKRLEDDEIEQIIFTGRGATKMQRLGPGAGVQAAANLAATSKSSGPGVGAPSMDIKRARKLFMSSKAEKVHQDVGNGRGGPAASSRPGADEHQPELDMSGLSSEEFKRLQLEVEKLGAQALDKKQRKAWQAKLLERLGAKVDRGPRVAAMIGKGLARKNAERAAKARQEAIEAGMVQVKGSGKKKKAEKAKQRDFGLQEMGPGFKNGVLKMKKPIKSPKAGGGKRMKLPNF